jgi:hypothetical protein
MMVTSPGQKAIDYLTQWGLCTEVEFVEEYPYDLVPEGGSVALGFGRWWHTSQWGLFS